MDLKMWIVLLAVLCIILCGSGTALLLFFVRRERRLTGRIQNMLDDAIAGKFREKHLDESPLSMIENQMWRYLCDREASLAYLTGQKEQLQAQISDISHQAVIPISNLVLYSQLLEEEIEARDLDGKEEITEETAAIREQAETLDFLMESLVKISRLETGIIHVSIKRQPLQPVLDTVKSQFQVMAVQKDIRFEVADTKESAAFDSKWTIEAAANIVDNAIKYTPDGGTVRIRVLSYSSLVRVDIEDTGIGIREEEQANVFSRFYRSGAVSERPGVGIGLYLAREVMKAQNGYIRLSSKVGEGSTFSLFFMKSDTPQQADGASV